MFKLIIMIVVFGLSYHFGAYDRLLKYYSKFMSGEEISLTELGEDFGDLKNLLPEELQQAQPPAQQDGIPKNFGIPGNVQGEMKDVSSLGGVERDISEIIRPDKE